MTIYTHSFVDLDAVCSVWAVKQFVPGMSSAEVVHVPANWKGEELVSGDIAVDIEANGAGIKGHKGSDGLVYSCFAAIVRQYAPAEDQQVLDLLMTFVDTQDAFGGIVSQLIPDASKEAKAIFATTNLVSVLRALQAYFPQNDKLVTERMGEILTGMLEQGRGRVRAESEADQAEVLPGGQVAIVTDSKEFATNALLFGRGIKIVVYVDGFNIGAVRANYCQLHLDHDELWSLIASVGEESQWFAHSAGFLLCRGSRKAKAENPSALSARQLAQAIAKLLDE